MKLPVPKFLANTEVKIEIAKGTDENGVLKIVDTILLNCRFEQSNGSTYTKEGTKTSLKGKCFIFESLSSFPDDMSGFCTINNIQYDIAHSSKKLNPDGSVNHVVLELI